MISRILAYASIVVLIVTITPANAQVETTRLDLIEGLGATANALKNQVSNAGVPNTAFSRPAPTSPSLSFPRESVGPEAALPISLPLIRSLQRDLTEISNLTSILAQRYRTTPTMSDAFARTLTFDNAALKRWSADPFHAGSTVASVRSDLEAKVANGNVAGGSPTIGSDVTVIVTTKLNQMDATGYLVRLNSRADEDASSPEFVFNDPSNPRTSAVLPAGNYVLWLEKDGSHFSRRYVSIAAASAPAISITVDIFPSK